MYDEFALDEEGVFGAEPPYGGDEEETEDEDGEGDETEGLDLGDDEDEGNTL